MSLTVPPKAHHNLAVVEDMDERLPVFLAQVAGVSGFLAPQCGGLHWWGECREGRSVQT